MTTADAGITYTIYRRPDGRVIVTFHDGPGSLQVNFNAADAARFFADGYTATRGPVLRRVRMAIRARGGVFS
mgnify:CR=1 FL=1